MVTSTHVSVRQMHLPITSLLTSCVSSNKLTVLASLFAFEKGDADTSMVESLQGVNDLMYANCLVVTYSFTHILFWPGTYVTILSDVCLCTSVCRVFTFLFGCGCFQGFLYYLVLLRNSSNSWHLEHQLRLWVSVLSLTPTGSKHCQDFKIMSPSCLGGWDEKEERVM